MILEGCPSSSIQSKSFLPTSSSFGNLLGNLENKGDEGLSVEGVRSLSVDQSLDIYSFVCYLDVDEGITPKRTVRVCGQKRGDSRDFLRKERQGRAQRDGAVESGLELPPKQELVEVSRKEHFNHPR